VYAFAEVGAERGELRDVSTKAERAESREKR
jgi:hypothetical protein